MVAKQKLAANGKEQILFKFQTRNKILRNQNLGLNQNV